MASQRFLVNAHSNFWFLRNLWKKYWFLSTGVDSLSISGQTQNILFVLIRIISPVTIWWQQDKDRMFYTVQIKIISLVTIWCQLTRQRQNVVYCTNQNYLPCYNLMSVNKTETECSICTIQSYLPCHNLMSVNKTETECSICTIQNYLPCHNLMLVNKTKTEGSILYKSK